MTPTWFAGRSSRAQMQYRSCAYLLSSYVLSCLSIHSYSWHRVFDADRYRVLTAARRCLVRPWRTVEDCADCSPDCSSFRRHVAGRQHRRHHHHHFRFVLSLFLYPRCVVFQGLKLKSDKVKIKVGVITGPERHPLRRCRAVRKERKAKCRDFTCSAKADKSA